jgi:hypothetical protein
MRRFWIAAAIMVLCATAVPGLTAGKRLLGQGSGIFRAMDLRTLPGFVFDGGLSDSERAYLGLQESGPFSISQIQADLVLVEFLNVYCYACVQQAPIMNEVYSVVASREDLRDRVRFLGIAVGNGTREIKRFHDQLEVPYPILADPEFRALDSIGNPGGTPFLILYPTRGGTAMGHLGIMADKAEFVKHIESALAKDRPSAAPELKLTTWRNLDPDLPRQELEEMLLKAAAEAGVEAAALRAVEVKGEKNVYRLEAADGSGLWAKVAGRAKVCNVCHDIFFILLFDDNGRIVNFTPILVTKYQNELINEREAAFMKERLLGKSVADPPAFDHEVDAITQATMSSELIFDTVRRLQEAFKSMQVTPDGTESR